MAISTYDDAIIKKFKRIRINKESVNRLEDVIDFIIIKLFFICHYNLLFIFIYYINNN